MGNKAKPARHHLLHGNPGHKTLDELARISAVSPHAAIPECPIYVTGEARAEWNRITPHLYELGLISHIDLSALVGYCVTYADIVWATKQINDADRKRSQAGRIHKAKSGVTRISAFIRMRQNSLNQLAKYLAMFGLSPAARTQVSKCEHDVPIPPKKGGKAAAAATGNVVSWDDFR